MVNADLIKSIRQGLGLTEYKFGQLVGLDQKTIETMEEGNKSVSLKSLKKIAEQFNLPLTSLVKD